MPRGILGPGGEGEPGPGLSPLPCTQVSGVPAPNLLKEGGEEGRQNIRSVSGNLHISPLNSHSAVGHGEPEVDGERQMWLASQFHASCSWIPYVSPFSLDFPISPKE